MQNIQAKLYHNIMNIKVFVIMKMKGIFDKIFNRYNLKKLIEVRKLTLAIIP